MKIEYNIAIEAAYEAGQKILEIYNTDDYQVTEKSDFSPLTKADRAAHDIIVSHLLKTNLPILSEEGRSIPYEERKNWQSFWLLDPLDGTKEFIKRNGEFTVNIAMIEEEKPVFGVVYAPVLKDLYLGLAGKGAWVVKTDNSFFNLEEVMRKGRRLELLTSSTPHSYTVVASRSHLNAETRNYLEKLESKLGTIQIVTKGSSLKLCMVASGEADEYPRLGPTMEWDVAAAHAIVKGVGKKVKIFGTVDELTYNKRNLLNPFFLVS